MKKFSIKIQVIPFIILIGIIISYSEISYVSLNPSCPEWEADSHYVGAGFIANGNEVTVIRKRLNEICPWLGELYFMVPGYSDSALFLLHNDYEEYPGESDTVNLGTFDSGTVIVFKYINIDTAYLAKPYKDKTLYSGQNRQGIDEYISEIENGYYNLRWAAAGRIDDVFCEMGFKSSDSYGFRDIMYKIKGVYLSGLEKFKIPLPNAEPAGQAFDTPFKVSLSVPEEGLKSIIYFNLSTIDTINPLDSGAILKIYYTTDGSTPTQTSSTLYTDSIQITKTTTLKARAILEGAADWFDSEVMEEIYTYTGIPIINNSNNNIIFPDILTEYAEVNVYNSQGRLINTLRNSNNAQIGNTLKGKSGIYFLQFKEKNKTFTKKIMLSW